MTTGRCCVIAVLLGGCATVAVDPSTFRISKFSQGLARVESQDKGLIYAQGTTFRYATNGACVEAGNTVPCMWFAVAFEYEAPAEVTNLVCATKFSKPVDVVDPTRVHGRDLKEFSGSVELKGKTGKAFWPGYVTTNGKPEPVRSTTVCSLEGKEVLKVDFTFN